MTSKKNELAAPAPEHCPGTESSEAGNAAACEGKQTSSLTLYTQV